ncbi:MAG: hypothetical protein HAW60_03275 [Bdellovibrionales bacterium]|nr:hypothetical protein [Bdellovibrionales bacterium]
MSGKPHIFVVSLYGKGHYIASLLSQEGCSVSLLNLQNPQPNQCLNIENLVGPFDFFEDTSDSLQKDFLNSFINFQNTSSGFTIWPKSGPIDFQSFIKNYALDSCGLNEENIEYLSNVNLLSFEEKNHLKKNLNHLDHSENWLSKLSHQLSASLFKLQDYNLEETITEAMPLFNKKKIAICSHNNLQNSLDWCVSNNVNVINIDKDLSITKNKNSIQSISYTNAETKQKESIAADKVVWTLNSQETKNIFPKIFPLLYKKALTPLWQWQKITTYIDEEYIPEFSNQSFLMINDKRLSFYGDNLCIVKKTSLSNIWNLWMCLPQQIPSEKIIKDSILNFFKDRIPKLKIKKIDVPKNSNTPLFPVFDNFNNLYTKTINNFYFCNFEACSNLDWPSFLNFQKNINNKIQKQINGSQ